MPLLTQLLSAHWSEVLVLLMVSARASGLMISAPFWGARVVPALVRIVVAVALSVAVYPLVKSAPVSAALPAQPLLGFVLLSLGAELLIGLAMGWAAQILFAGLRLAGQQIDLKIGLSISSIIDPQEGTQVAVFSAFIELLGALVFFAVNGHHLMIEALFSSYLLFPPGAGVLRIAPALVSSAGAIFAIALQVSAPVVVGLMLSNIILGIVNRSIPQMNVFIVGQPLQLFLGLLLLIFALPSLTEFVSRWLADAGLGLAHFSASAGGGS
jgi:flagellar biosynthetic protein FliR